MLPVALLGLALICNFFEEAFLPSLYVLACLLKFLTVHIYFHLEDCELFKQYQSVSQEMMGQIWNLETVEPQEIPIKVSVISRL